MLKRRVLIAALLFTVYGRLPAAAQNPLLPNLENARNGARDLDERHSHKRRIFWLVSVPVFVAANVIDAQSSWGKKETNPVLQGPAGQFSGRGLAIKLGASAGIIFGEYSLTRWFRGSPKRQDDIYLGSAVSNFLGAGVLTGAAIHNYGQPSSSTTGQR